MIIALKSNKFFIHKSLKLEKFVFDKMQSKKLCCYYKVSQVFGDSKPILGCIERFFTEIVESKSFAELEFDTVKRILSSSQLFITSELEVLNAAEAWVKHDVEARSGKAFELLQAVRLPLLSTSVLDCLLCGSSFFAKDAESVSYIEEILDRKTTKCTAGSVVEHRYCTHENFSLFVFTLDNSLNYTLNPNLNGEKGYSLTTLPPFECEERGFIYAAYCRGEVFVISDILDDKKVASIEKYSCQNKKWSKVAELYDDRKEYMFCVFMNELYFVGGRAKEGLKVPEHLEEIENYMVPTLVFNPVECKWREVARLNAPRESVSCCVFEGRVVASGGTANYNILTINEVYDHASDTWISMPEMLEERIEHNIHAIRNKLFLIGGQCKKCEVFDSCSNRFTYLKQPAKLFDAADCEFASASIANKIVFVGHQSIEEEFFDVERNEWVGPTCKLDGNIFEYSCIKVPLF